MFQITLKAARVNARMSGRVAAKKLNVSEDVLRNYENGRTVIPAHVLKKAARIYGVPEEVIRPSIVDDGEYDEEEKNLLCTTF